MIWLERPLSGSVLITELIYVYLFCLIVQLRSWAPIIGLINYLYLSIYLYVLARARIVRIWLEHPLSGSVLARARIVKICQQRCFNYCSRVKILTG